jgi:hypothetical protein
VGGAQQMAAVFEQAASGGIELRLAPFALEQGKTEVVLELADGVRNGREHDAGRRPRH